ncbi:MAG TPA: hypothetical protein VKQ29_03205 [Aliidongia sp.]|nr:hypothetical protein [Aliidongia sp.]
MSSISVQPASGPTAASPVKPGISSAESASTNETAKSQSATQGKASVLYPSPIDSIDPATSQLVIEYRNSATGDTEYQTPSKAQLRLYQISQSRVEIPGQAPTSPVPELSTSSVA